MGTSDRKLGLGRLANWLPPVAFVMDEAVLVGVTAINSASKALNADLEKFSVIPRIGDGESSDARAARP